MKKRGKGLLAICLSMICILLPWMQVRAEASYLYMGDTAFVDQTLTEVQLSDDIYVGSGGFTCNNVNVTLPTGASFGHNLVLRGDDINFINQGTIDGTIQVGGNNISIQSSSTVAKLLFMKTGSGAGLVGPKVTARNVEYWNGTIPAGVLAVENTFTLKSTGDVSTAGIDSIEAKSLDTMVCNDSASAISLKVIYQGEPITMSVPAGEIKSVVQCMPEQKLVSISMEDYRMDASVVPAPVIDINLYASDFIHDMNEYMYISKEATEATFTEEPPRVPGDYIVRAKFSNASSVTLFYVTADFTVLPMPAPTGSVTMANYYYGAAPTSPVASSETNGNEGVTFLYKEKGAGDDTYTATKPTKVGEYTVKASFPAKGGFEAFSTTTDFSVTYLPTPETPFVIGGLAGTNGFFTSDIVLNAPAGYEIAEAIAGPYVASLSFTESTTAGQIYLRQISTGAITASIPRAAVMIDKDLPTFDTEDGDYYSDKLMISVGDPNLSSVTVNGIPLKGDSALMYATLTAETEEVTYTIIATDLAGNETKRVITLYPAFEKTGTIKPGNLKCRSGKKYTLPEGDWSLSGDEGTYAGGMAVYVPSTGYYDLSQN
ncbi:MAG: hypothetical protein MJ105_02625 [Lachnospiraceae bacterium]|nr:hypothetical protein [Lachnospiraceae bacterium]